MEVEVKHLPQSKWFLRQRLLVATHPFPPSPLVMEPSFIPGGDAASEQSLLASISCTELGSYEFCQ